MSDTVNLNLRIDRVILIGQDDTCSGDVYLASSGDYLLVFGDKRNELIEATDCTRLGASDADIEDYDLDEIETYTSVEEVEV